MTACAPTCRLFELAWSIGAERQRGEHARAQEARKQRFILVIVRLFAEIRGNAAAEAEGDHTRGQKLEVVKGGIVDPLDIAGIVLDQKLDVIAAGGQRNVPKIIGAGQKPEPPYDGTVHDHIDAGRPLDGKLPPPGRPHVPSRLQSKAPGDADTEHIQRVLKPLAAQGQVPAGITHRPPGIIDDQPRPRPIEVTITVDLVVFIGEFGFEHRTEQIERCVEVDQELIEFPVLLLIFTFALAGIGGVRDAGEDVDIARERIRLIDIGRIDLFSARLTT